jgi:preprotein translocase subunit Sec63
VVCAPPAREYFSVMASTVFDPFEVLGVGRDASPEQIRTAYREQVARYHPDKHRGNPLEELAAAKLVDINRAYQILSGDRQRVRSGASGGRSGPSAAPASAPIAPHPAMKLVRSGGFLLAFVFLLRFGLVLGREMLALLRGFVLGVLWLFRLGPVMAIVVVFALALAASLLFRSRKG